MESGDGMRMSHSPISLDHFSSRFDTNIRPSGVSLAPFLLFFG